MHMCSNFKMICTSALLRFKFLITDEEITQESLYELNDELIDKLIPKVGPRLTFKQKLKQLKVIVLVLCLLCCSLFFASFLFFVSTGEPGDFISFEVQPEYLKQTQLKKQTKQNTVLKN